MRHCSAGVLLPSCGGGGGPWVPARLAGGGGTPGYWPALGNGGERRELSLKTPSWSWEFFCGKESLGKGPGTRDSELPSAIYVQRTELLVGVGGPRGFKSKPSPRGRCRAHAPGAGSPGSNQPSGSHSAETFGFPRDGDQGRSGHTLTECGDRGQQRGVWINQSCRGCWKIRARAEFPRAGRRGTVRSSAPILSSCPMGTRRGNAAMALGTAGLKDDPLPQATSDSWRLLASRAASQPVPLCSAARERPLRRRQ